MTIKRVLIFLITLICIMLNLSGLLLYKKQKQVQKSNGQVERSYLVINHIESFYADSEKMIAIKTSNLLTGNKAGAGSYAAAQADMEEHFIAAEKLTTDNAQMQHDLQKFGRLIGQLKRQLNAHKDDQPFILGNLHISVHDDYPEVHATAAQMRILSDKMLEEERDLLSKRQEGTQDIHNNYINTLLLSSIVSVAVILLGTFVLLRLLSRQRQTQEELNRTSERLELTLKGTNDGIIDWMVQSPNIYLSPRFREMLGYTSFELPDRLAAYESLIHPDDLKNVRLYTTRYLKENLSDYRNSFRLRHRDGTWRWHMVRAISMVDREHKKIRFIGAHTDITEQKTLEEKITASNKELEEFTYIASHDLRSPLVNLKGFAGEIEYILKRLSPIIAHAVPSLPKDEQKEIIEAVETDLPQAVGFIKSSVTRMDRLTQAILELSRLGRRELRVELLDVAKLVEAALQSLSHQISQKQVSVTVGKLPDVLADPVAIEQVFGNIIDNAIKYLDPSRPGKIHISGVKTDTETVFAIRDNGRGIAPGDIKKVFEIFKRAGNNDNIPGEGMGMPYIKSTLRRHGGKIWCVSTLGEGSNFYFSIPHHLPKETAHV